MGNYCHHNLVCVTYLVCCLTSEHDWISDSVFTWVIRSHCGLNKVNHPTCMMYHCIVQYHNAPRTHPIEWLQLRKEKVVKKYLNLSSVTEPV